MKKYTINYSYDEEDKRYVAVCPEFVGFILYCDTLEKLKTTSLIVLRSYTKKDTSAINVEFVEKEQEQQLGL